MSITMFNVKNIAYCISYYLVWNIFCGILLEKMNVDEY